MNTTDPTTPELPIMERRRGAPPPPPFGELLVELGWRPSDAPALEAEGWLRAHGYADDRRERSFEARTA